MRMSTRQVKRRAIQARLISLLRTSVASSVMMLSVAGGANAEQKPISDAALRGSSAVMEAPKLQSTYQVPTEIRGSTEYDSPREHGARSPLLAVGELAHGFAEATGHTLRSGFHTLIFRGNHDAVVERDAVIHLPDREGLRQTMMHSMSYNSGLRSGSASIGDSVAAGLRGSYSARQTIARSNAERARVHSAIANFLPKVEATVSTSRSRRYSVSTGTYDQDNSSANIELSIPIFTSGVNLNSFRQARHSSIAADYSHIAEEHRVAVETVTAHINLRLNRRVEKTLSQNVQAMQRIEHIATKLYEAGDASRTDIAIARANVESAKAELDIARRTREETDSDYRSLTGHEVPASLELALPSHLMPNSLDEAIELALQNNPTLQASRHTALASDYEARATRGRFGPQVSGFGRYNHSLHDSVQPDREDDWEFGVQVRVPLVDLTAIPTIDAARHAALENKYRSLDQARMVRREIERQWVSYNSASRRVVIVQRQVNAVAASVEGARREYEAGFRSITDVLNDQVRLARAKITLENSRHEKILAAYELAFTTAHSGLQELAALQ